jgi:S-adenosylmethionine:tRNA ribosyltransferase-isomerase
MDAAGVIDTFTVPAHLEASEPPEARGLRRDGVRLLISRVDTDSIVHSRFSELPRWLAPGDLLVVNTSGTLNAALSARTEDGDRFELHLSTRLPGNFWVVEVRRPGPVASLPYRHARAGTTFELNDGGHISILAPYPLVSTSGLSTLNKDQIAREVVLDQRRQATKGASSRLWIAALELPGPVLPYLARFGSPIHYSYVTRSWPESMYQTVFVTEPGSAEMPSAGRPFTPELVTRLVSNGIQIAPLLLHTGVASLEDHEPPYEEYFRVPAETAARVNTARQAGRRVVAVGTTVVRALETVTDYRGTTSAGEGWTNLVITRDRPLRAVNAMITGFHEPRATHLAMVTQAIAAAGGAHPSSHLDRAYQEAQQAAYLWHEFGDSHLIVGG